MSKVQRQRALGSAVSNVLSKLGRRLFSAHNEPRQRAAVLEMLETRQLLAALYWDTSASPGLQAGNGTWSTSDICWNTAADGNGSRVAWSAGYDAVFSASGSSTITVSGTITAPNITISAGTYSFGTGTLKLTGSGTVSSGATMELTSGTLSGAGTLTVNGTMNWTGGTMSDGMMGPGTTTIASGGVLNISGSADKTLSGHTLNNNGTINWSGGTVKGDSNGASGNGAVWNNSGTLSKSGSGTTTMQGVELTNSSSGTITVSEGTLDLTCGGTLGGTLATTSTGQMTFSSGSYSLSGVTLSGTGLNLNGGTFTLSSGLTIPSGTTLALSGTGTINGSGALTIASGGTLTRSGVGTSTISNALTNNGTVAVSAGTLAVSGGGTHTGSFSTASSSQLQFAGGTVTLNGASLSGSGSYTVGYGVTLTMGASGTTVASGATLSLDGGTINGSGTLSVNGTMNWTGGTMTGSGGVTQIGSTGVLNLSSGAGEMALTYRTLTNNGTINWIAGRIRGDNGATINNAGTFTVLGDNLLTTMGYGAQPALINSGRLNKNGGTCTTTIDQWALTNTSTGTISASSGTLDVSMVALSNSGTLKAIGLGAIQQLGSGRLSGMSGAMSGDELSLQWQGLPSTSGTTYSYEIGTLGADNQMTWEAIDVGTQTTAGHEFLSDLRRATTYQTRVTATEANGAKTIYEGTRSTTLDQPSQFGQRVLLGYVDENGNWAIQYNTPQLVAAGSNARAAYDIVTRNGSVTNGSVPIEDGGALYLHEQILVWCVINI